MEQLFAEAAYACCAKGDAPVHDVLAIRDALQQTVAGRAVVQAQTADLLWTFTPIESSGGEVRAVMATVCEQRPRRAIRCACGRICPPLPD
jgi:hypothetical protein